MGRRKKGWRLRRIGNDPTWYVRFTHNGKDVNLSTGQEDTGQAGLEAERLYLEIVSGRRAAKVGTGGASLAVLFAEWLASLESTHVETTRNQYEMYVRVHFLPYFGSLEEITTAGVADYSLRRLRSVKRKTVHKERGALHSFLWWCKGRHIDSVPLFDPLPKHATGKPDPQGRFKRHWVALTPEEVLAVLAELPVKSRRGYPARDYYTFLYETSLRPETVWSIHIPTDYKPGRATLKIRAEIDKNRFARDVELTDAARAALDAVCPEVGHPFPRSRLRETLRAAGLRAGLEPDRAGALSDYDFRHNRITHWTETAGDNLPGIAWLSGHKLITTLNNYAKPNARASRDVLARATGTKSNPEDIRRTSKTKERRTK